MNRQSFKRTQIATSLTLILSAAASSVYAQEETENANKADGREDAEVVEVRGIRGSLIQSRDVKRNAQGVVDAITSEDIGKFPDTNLAESLQRITGVSIDRQNGEGSRITVRGFGPDYNLVTLNGRQMPGASMEATSAPSSRSFDFANLASEAVAGVEVYKTSMAKLPTGGIGSTINILTTRPLNNPGQHASVGIKGVHDLSTETGSSLTPEISGIYSNTFADDKFGVAITASVQERDSGYKSAETSSGWYTIKGFDGDWGSLPNDNTVVNRPQENDVYAVPRNILYSFNEIQRTRTNGQLTLQFRPVETLTGTLDYTYSELEVAQQRNDLSAWFNGVHNFSEWTQGTNTVGSVVGPIIYSDNSCCDVGLGAGDWATKNENKSVGLNLQWQATDQLSFTLDYHDSSAESSPDSPWGSNNVVSAVQFDRVSTTVDYRNDFPIMDITFGPGISGLDPSRMMTSGTSFRNSYNLSEIQQAQLNGSFVFDEGVVKSIDFGLATTEVRNRSAFSNAQRDTWGGYGTPADYPDNIFSLRPVNFDLPGSGSANMEAFYAVVSMQDLMNAISSIANANGDDLGPCDTFLCPDPVYSTDRITTETQNAIYLQANLTEYWGDMRWNLAVGLRYEETEVDSTALVPVYDSIVWAGANEFVAQSSGEGLTNLKGEYDHLLPSVDFNIEVVDDVILRASYSETITRPSYSDIQGGQTINPLLRLTGGTGNSGNPALLPFESRNYDLSAEWYYGEGSYVSVGYFIKKADNFIAPDSFQETTFELPHPAQGPRYQQAVAAVGSDSAAVRQYFIDQGWVDGNGNIVGIAGEDASAVFTIIKPTNAQEGETKGFEFAIQHIFGDSGFGGIINYTPADSDLEYDDYNTNKAPGAENQFVLLGLSDTFNMVGFYDKDGIQVRLAYNWRDKFLTSTFDGNGERNPVYVEAYGQWDLNASYAYTDNLTFFVEGINVTGEYKRVHGRHENMVVAIIEQDPRYNIGVRYNF